jgi:oxygen-independent coproporphyrinogen-3 oxidase
MVNYLYIHIPFCIKKCIYCDFYSIPIIPPFPPLVEGKIGGVIADYIKALRKEIELRKGVADNLKTIYIGGGTPTILSEKEIAGLLQAMRDNHVIDPDAEITIEANPRTISENKAKKLLDSGINRISIGVQSFIDAELEVLGRSYNADDAIQSVKDMRSAGFKNISIDLIYGIPFLSSQESGVRSQELQIKNWEYSLQKALELSPEHISTYELTPEKNTPLYEDIKSGRLAMSDEGVIAEMYYKGLDMLKKHGYVHYEISNFAKSGYKCIHNLNYWNRGKYLGIGAGAHSFFSGKRTGNARDISRYIESINNNKMPVAEEHYITNDEALKEFILLGMRKTDGIDMKLLPDKKMVLMKKAVEELSSHGLVEVKGNYLRLTRKGLILSNEVIVQVLLSLEGSLPS